jgi:Flp pilus assembly pilin Flp
MLIKLWSEDSGASMVEYVLLIVLIAALSLGLITVIGETALSLFKVPGFSD